MKLKSVEIENYRAIERLHLALDPSLTVLHGDNTLGKTSILNAIATGLGVITRSLGDREELGFVETDARLGARNVRVALVTTDGMSWERRMVRDLDTQEPKVTFKEGKSLLKYLKSVAKVDSKGRAAAFPIVTSYGTDRSALNASRIPRPYTREAYEDRLDWDERMEDDTPYKVVRFQDVDRYGATRGALGARSNFGEFFKWFVNKENQELREKQRRQDFSYQLKALSAVRRAITLMLDGVSDARTDVDPPRFSVSISVENVSTHTLEIDQLSDGQRSVLALAADIAWRMAQGNPHLNDPLASEAIVLVDEIEQHLHPAWQQRILSDLTRTFPNAQFVVTTHSPQVLTTVKREQVVTLSREDGRIVASAPGWGTYGAEAGAVLRVVMGVRERPDNDFSRQLTDYRELVSRGEGESDEAHRLREILDGLAPNDPALATADLEIRQRKLFQKMAESS